MAFGFLMVRPAASLGKLWRNLTGIEQLRETITALKTRLEILQSENGALQSDNSTLQTENGALRSENDMLRSRAQSQTWVPPGHYYSPLVDASDEIVVRHLSKGIGDLTCAEDLSIDTAGLLVWFERISRYYPDLPFAAKKSTGLRYYYDNPAFTIADATAYFGFLRELKPAKLIEVGSGYSSCLAMDTNDLFLAGRMDLTLLDPYPDTLLRLMDEDDPYRTKIIASCVQDAPLSLFSGLEADDVLFIDSSHVAKMASDVNTYFFRIFPILKPGVVIHIHDIFYPFEYGADWIQVENRSWNEAYMLRAFLQYNSRFEILYFSHFADLRFGELIRQALPESLRDYGSSGGSIWLRKR